MGHRWPVGDELFGCAGSCLAEDEIRARVRECLDMVHLPGVESKRPSELKSSRKDPDKQFHVLTMDDGIEIISWHTSDESFESYYQAQGHRITASVKTARAAKKPAAKRTQTRHGHLRRCFQGLRIGLEIKRARDDSQFIQHVNAF